MVGFLAEMEVRGDRVLEEMDEQISCEHQQRRAAAAKFQAVRDDLDNGHTQHKAGTKRDKIFQVRAVPVLLHDDGAAENVRGGGSQSEQKTEQDGMH